MNELETKQQHWHDTLEVLKGLYPRWQVTTQQLMAWKEQFGMCNQEWLQEACTLMYRQWTGENPKPKWLADAFKQIRAGHQGIPLNESCAAAEQVQKDRQEWEQYVTQCDLDRAGNKKTLQEMEVTERVELAKRFLQKYPMFTDRNDPTKLETWSNTYCGFVCAFHRMELRVTK